MRLYRVEVLAGGEIPLHSHQAPLIGHMESGQLTLKKESGKNPFSSYRNTEQLVPLLQGLVKAERLLEAKDLLLAYVNKTNGSNLLYGEGKGLLPTILADDFRNIGLGEVAFLHEVSIGLGFFQGHAIFIDYQHLGNIHTLIVHGMIVCLHYLNWTR